MQVFLLQRESLSLNSERLIRDYPPKYKIPASFMQIPFRFSSTFVLKVQFITDTEMPFKIQDIPRYAWCLKSEIKDLTHAILVFSK